mgnify:CR=1 FL=1
MSGEDVKLAVNAGVELKPTATPGVSRAELLDVDKRFDLTWDRLLRLHGPLDFRRGVPARIARRA